MQQLGKIIGVFIIILGLGQSLVAQQEYATIKGVFTQKADAEIKVFQKLDGKIKPLVECFKDTGANNFSARFPVVEGAEYKLLVITLKPLGRGKDFDQVYSFPLQPQAGGIVNYAIDLQANDPQKLREVKNAKG